MRKYYLICSHTRTKSYPMVFIGKETMKHRVVALLVQSYTAGKQNWSLVSGLKLGMFCLLTWIPSSLSSPALFLADSDSGVSSVPSLALSFLSSLANGRLWQFTDWGWGCSKVRIRISHLPPHWGTTSASHSANLLTSLPHLLA